jgi:hypothetical protein
VPNLIVVDMIVTGRIVVGTIVVGRIVAGMEVVGRVVAGSVACVVVASWIAVGGRVRYSFIPS